MASKNYSNLIEKKLIRVIPDAAINHRWSGHVSETNDGLPPIGETASHQFVTTGFSGNGMTFGTLAARMACDRRNPWSELFDVNRKKARRGAWAYFKENEDSQYYFLKDRARKGEREFAGGDQARRRQGRENRWRMHRGLSERGGQAHAQVCSLHANGLSCAVESGGKELGLSVPRVAFQGNGEVLGGRAETPFDPAKEPDI